MSIQVKNGKNRVTVMSILFPETAVRSRSWSENRDLQFSGSST